MATINEFLPFADQSTANLIPYAEWVNAAKRLTGFVSGIAKSNEMNRVFAQGAQAGYAIAKFIERTLSEDVLSCDCPNVLPRHADRMHPNVSCPR